MRADSGGRLSKGKKILILVLLMIGSSWAFSFSRKAEYPGATNFFAFMTFGLLIAIIFVALSRSEPPGR